MRGSWSTSSSSTRPSSAHLPGGDASAAEKAIELYAGDLLPEDLYEPWAEAERERLRTRYLGLLRATGRWADLLAAEPLDEEAHLRVVHQYLEDGNRGQALRHLDSMAQLWRDELGAEPGAAAQALRAQVEAMSPYDPARVIPNRSATRVPRPATQTVGRDRDITRVLAMLDRHRLVTLLGIGGVGKTRLAAEVAHRYIEATSERACYVDLTKVRDAGLVPELTVRELGIRAGENQDVVQMLEEALRRQSLLLVLDNFEHVIDAADLVGEMVRWSDDLRLLVTSRARLRVAGEKVFEVQPLSLEPEAGASGLADAVALFEQVATAVDPWFELEQHVEDVDGHLPVRRRPPARDRDRRRPPPHPAAAAAAAAPRRSPGVGSRRRTRPPGPAADDPRDDRLEPEAARAGGATPVRTVRRLQRRGAARGRRGDLAGRRRRRPAQRAGRPQPGAPHDRQPGRATLRDAGAGAGARRQAPRR